MLRTTLFLLFVLLAASAGAQVRDSVSRPTLLITPRLNSAGHFPFTGSLINHHLNADVNIFYSRRTLGFFLFKSYDIADPHSVVNYFQPGVFANLQLRPTFKARVVFGYIFSQTDGFRDSDSDYYTAVAFYWDPSPNFHVEHTALFYDYTLNKKLANRLLAGWSSRPMKVEAYVWHRYVMDEDRQAVSAALALTFPKIKLSEKVSLQLTSTYMGYLTESKPDYALRDGFLFTLAAPITPL